MLAHLKILAYSVYSHPTFTLLISKLWLASTYPTIYHPNQCHPKLIKTTSVLNKKSNKGFEAKIPQHLSPLPHFQWNDISDIKRHSIRFYRTTHSPLSWTHHTAVLVLYKWNIFPQCPLPTMPTVPQVWLLLAMALLHQQVFPETQFFFFTFSSFQVTACLS